MDTPDFFRIRLDAMLDRRHPLVMLAVIDTTVMEKAIAYPTDSRLLEIARHKLVKIAKHHGVALKQTFAK